MNFIKLIKELVEHELTQELRTIDTLPYSKAKHTYLQCNINDKLYVSDVNFKFPLTKEPRITLEQVWIKEYFFLQTLAFLCKFCLSFPLLLHVHLPHGSVVGAPFLDLGPFSLFTENS